MQLIVLGMHRSGTSIVARLLNMMGAYFAPEEQALEPQPDNPKGLWERKDVRALNNEILQAAGASWYKISHFDLNTIDPHYKDLFAIRIKGLVSKLDSHRPWMLKDPQLCLTFPVWRPHLEVPVVVLMHRNPVQIAQSLARQDHRPLHYGLAMWEVYTVATLQATIGLPRLLVYQRDLVADPLAATHTLYEQLESYGVRGLRMPTERELTAYIDPELQHEKDGEDAYADYLNLNQATLANAFADGSILEEDKALKVSPGTIELLSHYHDFATSISTLQQEKHSVRQALATNQAEQNSPVLTLPSTAPKLIAFYLPQFHPTQENDQFWGKGFTEWTNVTRGRQLFKGHHQPHLPADLGFYDLRLPEVRETQAQLARQFGIHAFCYYFYWFDTRRLLHRPLDEVLASGRPDFPFCICWANESWSRRWDGGSKSEILMHQRYDEGFAERLAEELIPLLRDPRYVRIEGRPLLVVYRLDQIPNPRETAAAWRTIFHDSGVGDVLLAAVEGFGCTNPLPYGFDIAIEFPPHNPPHREYNPQDPGKLVEDLDPQFCGQVRDYQDCVDSRISLRPADYPRFRGIMTQWDNTARMDVRAMIYHNASPALYEKWLDAVLHSAAEDSAPYPPLVFINAWNEWAEGAHLEPDQRNGSAYLQATAASLARFGEASIPDDHLRQQDTDLHRSR